MQKNELIRVAAKNAGVRLWQIAEAVGLSDGSFSRKLRHEFTADEQERILNIIKELAKEAS